jgi:hypothetical protein
MAYIDYKLFGKMTDKVVGRNKVPENANIKYPLSCRSKPYRQRNNNRNNQEYG